MKNSDKSLNVLQSKEYIVFMILVFMLIVLFGKEPDLMSAIINKLNCN